MENQKFQVKLPGCHRAKSLQINKAVPARIGKAALTAPEIFNAQGKQSSFFLKKWTLTRGLSVQAKTQVIKCSFGWQPVLTWTKDMSWPLNQCLRPQISEALIKIGGQGAGEVNNFIWNYTEVEDHGDKCRKCSVEHQRGTHIVNPKFNLPQNVKMGQGCELSGNHLRHGSNSGSKYISIL